MCEAPVSFSAPGMSSSPCAVEAPALRYPALVVDAACAPAGRCLRLIARQTAATFADGDRSVVQLIGPFLALEEPADCGMRIAGCSTGSVRSSSVPARMHHAEQAKWADPSRC